MPDDQPPFVHLHFHTAYSLLDGACRVKDVMAKADRLGMKAAALTDHGVMYGAIEFYKQAKAHGVKPILGCEVYMAHGSMHERKTGPGGSQSNHLVLLAENERGFHNLQRMVSRAHLEGFYYKPRIDKELLAANAEGIIGLSACLKGEVTEACYRDGYEKALGIAGEYTDILGRDNFFIELQDHGIREQRIANEHLLRISKDLDLPIVCSNDVHYLDRDHAEAHDCMICLQTAASFNDPNRMRYHGDQFYMKTGAEMLALFPDHPEALHNTLLVAERCNVELRLDQDLHFPQYQAPEGMTQKEYLIQLGGEGLRRRYGIEDIHHPKDPDEKRVVDRFFYELGIIEKTQFINYFLVVWDFIDYARRQHIPVGPGRGSGAGSILAYALGITDIDPLRYKLIFERFLNPERVSPPDFDIDFCMSRRGEVIEYVKRKYGRENVAQIITFGTLGPKTVIRDVGRVLEVPFGECDRLAKMVPEDPNMTLEKALEMNPDFKKVTQSDENARRIMKYARVLEGLPRNPGTHAAGVVIGEKPLAELIPLARDKNQEPVTQFEMKPLEQTGLLKMDFLGLKTLTVIQEAIENVRAVHGVEVDFATIPMDDPETFALLNRGNTIGVFQVESKGMRDLLRRIGLDRFEDLIAMIALYRPGPMNMLDDFVKRKHGKVKIAYDHPLLEPILEETYGVMLYQEQVQQAANVLAGFSLGQGDILRRAMGKKIPEAMAAQRDRFIGGCKQTNRIPAPLAEKIFNHIEQFAGYGFNKSHSAAYAMISYQTAWLKAHYPGAFMAALLSCEMGNADKLPVFINEAHDMGMKVLPPCVNESRVRFYPVEAGIRFGLAGIKNVGVGAVEAIVAEREAHGLFTGLMDFCTRVDPHICNKKVLESLVKCGAFDFSGMSRGRVFENIEFALSRAASAQRDRASGQGSLFDMLEPEAEGEAEELPDHPPWPENLMLAAEKELLGFYISGHPLQQYAWELERFNLVSPDQLAGLDDGAPVRIGGLVSQFQKRYTRRDQEAMGVFTLVFMERAVETVVFPEAYRSCQAILADDAPVLVCGQFKLKDGEPQITADEVYLLQDAAKLFTNRVSLHVPAARLTDEKLETLREIVRRFPGDTRLFVCLEMPEGEKVFIQADAMFAVQPCRELTQELERVLGEDSVYIDVIRKPTLRERKSRFGNGSRSRRPAGAAR